MEIQIFFGLELERANEQLEYDCEYFSEIVCFICAQQSPNRSASQKLRSRRLHQKPKPQPQLPKMRTRTSESLRLAARLSR